MESVFNKVAGPRNSNTGVFCEICELFKNTYFEEHLRKTASSAKDCFHIFIIILIIIITIITFTIVIKCTFIIRILLPILLDCKMKCLFQSSFFRFLFFSSVIPSFSLFTPSQRTQNSFTISRQVLDVLFILIFISIVIYTSLFTLTDLYLFTLTYLYLRFLYTSM